MSLQPALLSTREHGLSLDYAAILMARESVTPTDAGCQTFLMHRLTKLGFTCEQHVVNGVSNLIARWGQGSHHLAFCGHTDVVPPGPLEKWNTAPFCPTVNNNRLYGRGAADMKTGVAAMLAATERSLKGVSPGETSFWWLITSDEEGEAEYGSQWIYGYLKRQGIVMDQCIVGEPTAAKVTGDTIKVGRRGSLSASIRVTGKQGHVAYPHSAINAIHSSAKIINALTDYEWDEGSHDFPGTTLQITHIDSGSFTDNLVPGQCEIQFNVRYSHCYSETTLKAHLASLIHEADNSALISWSRPCEAYLSKPIEAHCLINSIEQAIFRATGRYPVLSTSGGTSDGRFFAGHHTQVVEVGVPNETIHQVNESIHVSDLMTLEDIYTDLIASLVATKAKQCTLPFRTGCQVSQQSVT